MPRNRLLVLVLLLVAVVGVGVGIVTAQESTYTVEYGDVLDVIAASMDMDADCIAENSRLDNPNELRPGDTLIFSPDCPPYDGLIPIVRETSAQDDTGADEDAGQGGGGAAQTATTSGGSAYVVQQGDVLDLIAAAHDVSVRCLAQANNLSNAGRIFPGDELVIDLDCPRYDGEAFVTNPREGVNDLSALGQGGGGGGTRTYIVEVGDVLDLIAAQVNLSASCLAEANNLENPGRIFPGDEIVIDPGCPPYDGLALNS